MQLFLDAKDRDGVDCIVCIELASGCRLDKDFVKPCQLLRHRCSVVNVSNFGLRNLTFQGGGEYAVIVVDWVEGGGLRCRVSAG